MGLLDQYLGMTPTASPSFDALDAASAPALDPLAESEAARQAAADRLKRQKRPLPEWGSDAQPVPFSNVGLLSPNGGAPAPAPDLPPSANDPMAGEPVVFSGGVPVPRPRPVTPNTPASVSDQSTDVSSANATPSAPLSMAPPQPAMPQAQPQTAPGGFGGIGDVIGKILRPENAPLLMSLAGGFSGAPSLGTGMRRAFSGAAPASMQLAQFQQQQQTQAATYKALIDKGVPPAEAIAAVRDPNVMKATAAKYFETKPFSVHDVTGPLGDKTPVVFDPNKGAFQDMAGKPIAGTGGTDAAGTGTGSPQVLAPGVKFDSTKTGEDYLNQFSPEIKAAVKNYMNGDTMPTGNPRQNGIANFAKTVAQRYGADTGTPVSDALYNQKRQLQTDIGKGSPNTVGGIMKNGLSAFTHLSNLGDKFVELGNYSGPDIPGGGHLGKIGNVVANQILPTPQKLGKIEAVKDNALKYGQEATKFYAGSGGGAEERMAALKGVGGGTANAEEQASFLETEKQLMIERLHAQHDSVRSILGQDYIDRHPDIFNPKGYQSAIAKIDANIARLRQGAAAPAKSQAPSGKTSTGIQWSVQ